MKFYTNVQLIGDKFLVRGYENGKRIKIRDEFTPTFYVPSKKKTQYKTLEGEYVSPIQPGTVRECRSFLKEYDGVEGFNIYGNERYIYQYISQKYPQSEIQFDISKINLVTIDIEVASESGFPTVEESIEEMTAISIQDYNTKEITVWGVGDYRLHQDNVTYNRCWSEQELLTQFIDWWSQNTPDVVTGWNCQLYDIPYLVRRLQKVLGEKKAKYLSPWSLLSENETYIAGRKYISFDVGGITVLDYMDLYKKFTYKAQESYRLDHIAHVELGQRKIANPYDTFKDFYTNDWQKFIEYNIRDVELVDRLEDKMKLIELAITMAFDAKVNFTDVFYQVRMWDTIIYNYLKKRNIVIPPKVKSTKDERYAGAYVKEPKPGSYDWVVSFDLNSLYPHLIMQYNISPETLWETRCASASVERFLNQEVELKEDLAVCANGAQYRRDVRGFLPELMEKIYKERTIFKKKMIQAKKDNEKTPSKAFEKEIARCNNIQMARKIQLNSAYGAIGNQYFRYYKLANAEAITLSGQLSIRWIENDMNKYLNKILETEGEDYVIASDTDSIYLHLGPLVDKFFGTVSDTTKIVDLLDKICVDKFQPFIDTSYNKLANYVNAYSQKMVMARENIAVRGIWTAKKRYILNVWDSEGVRYNEPKLKMMGIEAVKSSTPAPCRDKIKDCLKVIMNETEADAIKFIQDFRKTFKKLPAEEIAFPRTASNVEKWMDRTTVYKKGTPIHVRGALMYNKKITDNDLGHKYPTINNGEKIKFIYLKLPNVVGENVISFVSEFPKELNIEPYIDYDIQFNKSFVEPVKAILDAIGWEVEKRQTLDAFFV